MHPPVQFNNILSIHPVTIISVCCNGKAILSFRVRDAFTAEEGDCFDSESEEFLKKGGLDWGFADFGWN